MFDVIGFGALNVDNIYDSEYRLQTVSGGGQAANTVVALSRMGFKCGYVGKVGSYSSNSLLLISSLALEKVDTSQISAGGFIESGIADIVLSEKGERTISITPGANDRLTYERLDIAYLKSAKFLHLSSFLGDAPFEAQKRVVKKLAGKVNFSLDPDIIYAKKGIDELLPLLQELLVIFPTQEELEVMTAKDYQDGARKLLGLGVGIVACTRGEKGCHIFSQEMEYYEVPAEPPADKVLDTTGAGDVFAAGFLAGLFLGGDLRACAKLANKAAGLSITGYGRTNYPDKEFLEEAIKNV